MTKQMNDINYRLLSDCLWYLGHILTGVTIVINRYDFYAAIAVVMIGQFLIIISRPIGRIVGGK
jgi:hypothetical protein